MRLTITALIFLGSLPGVTAPLSYNRDVRPILAENCFSCHGPDKNAREAKLRLDVRADALAAEAFVPGDPSKSEIIHRLHTKDPEEIMPPPESHRVLTSAQKKILSDWVTQGAEYEPHWAYIVPKRPNVPEMGASHPVDNFILAGMAEGSRKLSARADKDTLRKRISFDLTGLPASLHEIETLNVQSSIDHLLSSPHFGERMAVMWLDLARYADSHGYHSDKTWSVTPYRDYVIRAFNHNKPYDTFIVEQLAGDLLKKPTTEQYVATGFNRVNQVSEEGGIQDAEYIAKYYAERVRTTSVAFLGSTMGCSECHDHKFDPFTAKDFYSMEAFFSDIYEKGAYNGDGRYNPGADIKKYPGFKLDKWGPALDVPEPKNTDELTRIEAEKNTLEKELEVTGPQLEKDFLAWIKNLRGKISANTPKDLPILDDNELPLEGVQTVTENVHSGKVARRQTSSGLVQHIVNAGSKPISLGDGEQLFAYVWLNPKNPPRQIMLQFNAENSWEHRAWWGEDLIPYGRGSNGPDHHRAGDLPATGKWVRIEVSAEKVGLPAGTKITQLAYTQHAGEVLWDLAGRTTSDAGAALAGIPENLRKQLLAAGNKKIDAELRGPLMDHFRTIAPSLQPVRDKIAKLDQQAKGSMGSTRMTLVTLSANPREIRILPRGDWMDRSGPVVEPALPDFLATDAQKIKPGQDRLTRLDLAQWIASKDNPLTARALVNRVWALFLGTGLSRDLQDLGNQGQWPTHPELLDWLAVEFMESDWNIKHLVKLILTSETYQQSSNASRDMTGSDPYNLLYSRQNSRRLPAEFIRDNALAVSGLLNPMIGGASARPYQPAGYYRELNFPKRTYKQHNDQSQYRRGVYMHWQRSFLHPMLVAFDAPPREECTASRETSNTPQQALNLLNDPTFVEAARVLAEKLTGDSRPFNERLEMGFQQLLQRKPHPEESKLLKELYDRQLKRYIQSPEEANALLKVGLHTAGREANPMDLAAFTSVTRALLNLHETITRY